VASIAISSRSATALFLARLSFVAWTFAVFLYVNRVFEWTFPYCHVQGDGPIKPAFGFPLPYLQENAAFTLAPQYMPHVLLLNLVLLAALAYPFMDWAVRWLSAAGRIVGVLIAMPGVLLALFLGTVCLWLELEAGFAVSTIAMSPDRYWDYRPLGMRFGELRDCTPSEYWFGPIKKNASIADMASR
jgi:hypothetical protein